MHQTLMRKIRFRRTLSTKTIQVSHMETVLRFMRQPNGWVSRLSTNKLFLAARESCKFGNICPSSGVRWRQTLKIYAVILTLLHYWLHQIVFLQVKPRFANSVTDGLIRHATPVLYRALYLACLWSVLRLKWSNLRESKLYCARVHFG